MDRKLILPLVLFLLFLGALFWGFGQRSHAENVREERDLLDRELDQMGLLRDGLAHQVDSLSLLYENALHENEELAGSLADTEDRLQTTQSALARAREAKAETARSAHNIRVQIEDLLAVRAQLERQVSDLQAQNDSLRQSNVDLRNDLSRSRMETEDLSQLNAALQRDIDALTLDNFKATAFQVEPLRRNEKIDGRSRRIRSILVEFDLAGVPEEYQGVRPVYLVLTDIAGTPIPTQSPVVRTISVNGSETTIRAQEMRELNIERSQRITFNHQLDDRLRPGLYRAQVYTDIGILGGANFRLR